MQGIWQSDRIQDLLDENLVTDELFHLRAEAEAKAFCKEPFLASLSPRRVLQGLDVARLDMLTGWTWSIPANSIKRECRICVKSQYEGESPVDEERPSSRLKSSVVG